MRFLVTGSAGFIGFFVCKKILDEGHEVVGIDNLNDYYDINLKIARLAALKKYNNFRFIKADICDSVSLDKIFSDFKPNKICHLAAQAGVRNSITAPLVYEKVNVSGFLVLLETMKKHGVKDLVYASSSSVYGNKQGPCKEDSDLHPMSVYAATKLTDEMLAETYNRLFGIRSIGLRFFSVYGPWGRPDMAYYLFTEAIINNKPIKIFNNGLMKRDLTFVDDIADGVCKALIKVENFNFESINLGNNKPIALKKMVTIIEKNIGKKAEKKLMPMQQGDVAETWADISKAKKLLGYNPSTKFEDGFAKFISWYRDYYSK